MGSGSPSANVPVPPTCLTEASVPLHGWGAVAVSWAGPERYERWWSQPLARYHLDPPGADPAPSWARHV